jgi:hypothetical protein
MTISHIGFIGTGVMGEPMCANLAGKCGLPVTAFDLDAGPLARLAVSGVATAASVADLVAVADLILLSLPGGDQLSALCESDLFEHTRAGQIIVDTSTSPVELTRELAAKFADKGVAFADAPIARTRQAAQTGTLSIMVGADEELFAAIRPVLDHMASDVTHCGGVGTGQIAKILNNMVLMQTVLALAEALTIGRRAGIEGEVLFDTLSKGSADSFALRNHGLKALLPGEFPLRAFSTEYARKDLAYALDLAADQGVEATGAKNVGDILQAAQDLGLGPNYWPALLKVVEGGD